MYICRLRSLLNSASVKYNMKMSHSYELSMWPWHRNDHIAKTSSKEKFALDISRFSFEGSKGK